MPIGLHALQFLWLERAALRSGVRRTVGADSDDVEFICLCDTPRGRIAFYERAALICINVRTESQCFSNSVEGAVVAGAL